MKKPGETSHKRLRHLNRNRPSNIYEKPRGKMLYGKEGAKAKKGPVISHSFVKQCKLEAEQLAARIAKGKKSANAKTSGPVKQYTREELEAYAAKHGFGVKS